MCLEHFKHCCFDYCWHHQDLCKATEPLDAQFLWLPEGDKWSRGCGDKVKPQYAKSWFPSTSRKLGECSGHQVGWRGEGWVQEGGEKKESASWWARHQWSFPLSTSFRGQLVDTFSPPQSSRWLQERELCSQQPETLRFSLLSADKLTGSQFRIYFCFMMMQKGCPFHRKYFKFWISISFPPRLCSVMASPNARQFPRLPFIFKIYTLVYLSLRDDAWWVGHIKGISTCVTFQVLLRYWDTEAKCLLTHSVTALEYQNTSPSFQWLPISSHLVTWGDGSAEWTDYKWGANSAWPAPHFLAQGSFHCANPQSLFF